MMTITWFATAQTPDWQVNPNNYEYSMSLTGIMSINSEEHTNTNSKLAAWVGNELRGVADPIYVAATNRYYYQILIYANTEGEEVSYRFYNADNNQITDLLNTKSFKSDQNAGSFSDPYIFRNWENKVFNAFFFIGLDAKATIDASTNSISFVLPEGTDITNLTAQYQFDHAISVQVDGVEQESGTTVNDFSNTMTYHVNTGINTYIWTVKVSIENSVTGINTLRDTHYIFYPNPASSEININLINDAKVIISDNSGKVVLSEKLSVSNKILNIDRLRAGVYSIIVQSKDEIYYSQLIKK